MSVLECFTSGAVLGLSDDKCVPISLIRFAKIDSLLFRHVISGEFLRIPREARAVGFMSLSVTLQLEENLRLFALIAVNLKIVAYLGTNAVLTPPRVGRTATPYEQVANSPPMALLHQRRTNGVGFKLTMH